MSELYCKRRILHSLYDRQRGSWNGNWLLLSEIYSVHNKCVKMGFNRKRRLSSILFIGCVKMECSNYLIKRCQASHWAERIINYGLRNFVNPSSSTVSRLRKSYWFQLISVFNLTRNSERTLLLIFSFLPRSSWNFIAIKAKIQTLLLLLLMFLICHSHV